ncbi:hypothetical protein [Rhodospirillum centenum]|uniref:Uncharacterized protein n=1 Tax=Rhodospirillum centenum (strain ATCC 51521 / SW) TaxID=414684 RepID=B6IVA6_RHOCS|nr:hypothetical protein [Rhodospirillum centenum]ACJ00230.1 hypothetical protein RC1_2860 [Rhodospirillum centenum SW]
MQQTSPAHQSPPTPPPAPAYQTDPVGRDMPAGSPQLQEERRAADTSPGRRVARLAWFELATAATHQELLAELHGPDGDGADRYGTAPAGEH